MTDGARLPALPSGWGVLATGGIADDFCSDLAMVPGAAIAAVGSRRQASADAFAARHGAPRAHGSYDALLSDPDVDVVYVATPHPFHEQNVLAALDAGKAVLCEKPLGMRAARPRRSSTSHGSAGCSSWRPCGCGARRTSGGSATSWRPAGSAVRNVRADLGFVVDRARPARMVTPALGASTLLDVGVYPLHLVTMLLGAPSRSPAPRCSPSAASTTSARLVLPSGAVAALTASMTSTSPRTATIATTDGRIEVPAPFHHPSYFTWRPTGGDGPHRRHRAGARAGHGHEAIEVQRCLHEGRTESPLVPLDETVLVPGCSTRPGRSGVDCRGTPDARLPASDPRGPRAR